MQYACRTFRFYIFFRLYLHRRHISFFLYQKVYFGVGIGREIVWRILRLCDDLLINILFR